MKVLLVEDEPGIREGLAILLRRQGLDVRTAADCAGARAALDLDFDVVVTDWRLPDGRAATFVDGARCPVIAVSGHPEEVDGTPGIARVLTKPVSPARLGEAIVALARPVAPPTAPSPLPVDVQAAVAGFVDQLPADAVVDLRDDGTFVDVEAELPGGLPASLRGRDGDLTWTARGRGVQARLRLYRDGRADGAAPIVRALPETWPDAGAFAVDFHDTELAPDQFDRCLDAARNAAAAGRRVQFFNVPPALRSRAESHGRAGDMPMRDAVGPRLPADLADLWRQP